VIVLDDATSARSETEGPNASEGPENLDFLFYSRLYSEPSQKSGGALTYERRTGGQVRRDGL